MSVYIMMLLLTFNGGMQMEVAVPYGIHSKAICAERGPVFARAVYSQYREELINVQWKCVKYGDLI